jgi:hypothetical protein
VEEVRLKLDQYIDEINAELPAYYSEVLDKLQNLDYFLDDESFFGDESVNWEPPQMVNQKKLSEKIGNKKKMDVYR